MEPFKTFTGIVMPLDQRDVDTDMIIPARYMKGITREGFGARLFNNRRYLPGTETPVPEFRLNQPRYATAEILLARANFGCGSSREHAPWALRDWGFRVIIAPSFGDIFYNNCFNCGILPIRFAENRVERLFVSEAMVEGYRLTVDLAGRQVTTVEQEIYPFVIGQFQQKMLLGGLSTIDLTRSYLDDISAYEQRQK